MYEDLEQIANLKFGKEMQSISSETQEKIKEMQNEYAALIGSSGGRSGQHEASIGRVRIDGAERRVCALFQVWTDLIERRNGHISRVDIGFIAEKVDSCARTQKAHLHTTFSQQRLGAVASLLSQEADMRMHAAVANARRDLEIMVRETEAFARRSAEEGKEASGLGNLNSEVKPTRHFAEVLNILIASPL